MSKIDLTNLNKIDTDLIMPSTSEENVNLQKQQENKWGSILNNQTFNTLNNNIKLLKNSLVETINTLNNENIIAKNKYINEDNDIVSLGDNTKKLNFLTTQIQVNGVDTEFLTSQNLSNISNIAYKDKENTFTFPLNTNQYKINSNQVISDDNDNINIGNSQRKLNLQSSDGKLYLNGQEFKGGSNNENQNIGNNDEISEYLKKSSFSYYFEDLISFDISYSKIDNEKIKKTIVENPDNKLGYVYYTARNDLYFFGIILGWDFKKTNSYKKLGKYFKDNFKKLKKISNNYKIYLIVDYQENIKLVGINGKRIFFNCVRNEYNTVRYDNSLNSGILNFEKFNGNSENEDDVVRFILLNLSINLGKDVLIIDNNENNFNINNNDEEVSFQFLANNIIMLSYRRWTIGDYLDYLGGNIMDNITNNKFNVEFLIKGLKFVPR